MLHRGTSRTCRPSAAGGEQEHRQAQLDRVSESTRSVSRYFRQAVKKTMLPEIRLHVRPARCNHLVAMLSDNRLVVPQTRIARSVDRPPCGGGKALSEAVGVSEVREVAASWPDGNGGLGEHLAQPPLIVGIEIGASHDEVRYARGPQRRQPSYRCKQGSSRLAFRRGHGDRVPPYDVVGTRMPRCAADGRRWATGCSASDARREPSDYY